ncbi:MAG: hypothetical protein N2512_15035, partial [Armatimonadetes bacterium]|nr:hypothetical protein [Armatimonadota bacterium]
MSNTTVERPVSFLRGRLRPARIGLALADAVWVSAALLLAAVCHYNGNIPGRVWESLQATAALAAALLVATNILFGLYN